MAVPTVAASMDRTVGEPEKNKTDMMVVGDSISHGREGDWTWRYRMWEYFRQESIGVRFVGPYKGTVPPDEPRPPRPPRLPEEPLELPPPLRTDGGYAAGVDRDFLADSYHFAVGGRQAYDAKDLIAEQIAAYQPDFCLVQLGFNDLAWRRCGAIQTLASIKQLVDEARSVKPDLKFAIADIPQRTYVPGREDLPIETDIYNRMLALSIPSWNTRESPVALVRFCENYSCGGTNSEAAYDGLHPNALGEYQLAQAFSQTLISDLCLNRDPLVIPDHIPLRPVPTPARFKAVSTPGGIVVTWDAVYGAFGYDLQYRHVGQRDWSATHAACSRFYWPPLRKGQAVECRVRTSGGDNVKSPWSEISSAVANPETAPPPTKIITHPTATGFTISWDDPPPPYPGEIDRYGIFYLDSDQPGAFICAVGAKGNRAELTGLTPGHRYYIMMDTWNTFGVGLPAPASAVVVGRGTPSSPRPLRARTLDSQNVKLTWPEVDGAAGYGIMFRRDPAVSHVRLTLLKPAVRNDTSDPKLVTTVLWMRQSPWKFQYAVWAYNGDDLSGTSEWARPAPLAPVEVSLMDSDSIHIRVHAAGR